MQKITPRAGIAAASRAGERPNGPGEDLAIGRGVKPRVLVVDDSHESRNALVLALCHAGFDAVPAANGAEALAFLSEGNVVDVILLDLVMPVMDGWTFRRAQQRDSWLADIPVIAVTALEGRPLSGLGAVAAFRKPIDLHAVVDRVRAVCRRAARFRGGAAPVP